MTKRPTSRARVLGVGALAAALCAASAVSATADPNDIEDLGNAADFGVAVPRQSLEELLSEYEGQPRVANRWFVEVQGAAEVDGGSKASVKTSQDNVVRAARSAGVKVAVTQSYSALWNGMSVSVTDEEAVKLSSVAGVTAVYPVLKFDRPITFDDTTPAMEYANQMTGADVAQTELGLSGEGVRVGIIDSGIDYNHPAFGGAGVNDETADFPDGRVKWGYDFVGDAYDSGSDDPAIATPRPDAWPDDCGGHGTHVAGIVGAAGEITGVAPGVEFGAYRVFGCDGSSDSDVINAAMERAWADGMDVVNMSLGAAFATWPSYPTAQAADALVQAGVVVTISQGNEGTAGTFSGGAPSVAHDVISVGAVDNTRFMADYVTTSAGLEVPFSQAEGAPAPDGGSSFELIAAPGETLGLGCAGSIAPAAEEGQALLVSRGSCSFAEKALTAQAAGYEALLIANNIPGIINPTVAGSPVTIPVVSVLQTDGAALRAEAPTQIAFSEEPKRFDNPTGGYQSDFSSYGLAADLTLKPDVSAPGGSIYSTYPLEKGGAFSTGGTSMAAPHVAGAAALLLEADPGLDPFDVRRALTNTADQLDWSVTKDVGLYEPVHRQGGGLIDIPQAVLSLTSASPSKISLGEGEAGPITTTVTVRNDSDAAVTYALGARHGVATYGATYSPQFAAAFADVSFSSDSITVPAGGSATVDVTIGEDFGMDGVIYGGWVTLTSETAELTIPFAGLSGDYQALTAFDGLLAYQGEAGLALAEPFHEYSMVDGDYPIIFFALDYPTNAIYFDIYKANADGTKGAKVHSNFINYATFIDEGRLAGAVTIPWDGTYQGNNGNNKYRRVSDGDYVLEVRVLKALGDPSNPDHWEIWNSPAFTINYGEGADTGAGNGPGGKGRN